MEDIQKGNKLRLITWFGVVAIFFAAGLALYQGVETLELRAPQLSSSLENTVDEIKRLDIEYAEAIEDKAKFRDMWSLIAVVTAVLSAAAVALRAPQPFVIMPSAFLALVYGALELQSPQTIISSLAKARSSLACVESPIRELVTVKELYLDEIDGLVERLERNSENLSTYSIKLRTYNQRLNEVLQTKSEPRNQAMIAIDNGLMIVIEENKLAIKAIEEYIKKLSFLEGYVSNEVNTKNDSHSLQIQEKLKEIGSLLKNSLDHLESPKPLQQKLRLGLKTYLEQLVRSNSVKNKAEVQLKKTLIVLSKTEPTTISLKIWPKQLKLASLSANKAVRDIHSTLLHEIAQAGSTTGQLAKVLEVSPTSLEIVELPIDIRIIPDLDSSPLSNTVSPPIHRFSNIALEVSNFESDVKATLKKFSSNIENAHDTASKFQKIIDTYLVVLTQATELFEDATQILESTFNFYSGYLYISLNALEKSDQIFEHVNFLELKSEVATCMSAGQRSTVRLGE